MVTNNVLYADALEWDYSGEYLIYDAYNELTNEEGDDISYWDMGLLRVWDKTANNWGDGEIFKIFSALPEGISVGDPSFSKNSPYIIAFDLLEESSGLAHVLAANLVSGEIGTIYENNTVLGMPNYSKLDNKLVFSAMGNKDTEVVGVVNLNSDKITTNGEASLLIDMAKWPVWFSTGKRSLLDVTENTMGDIFANAYPNPFGNEVTLVAEIKNNNPYDVKVYNVFGQLVKETSGVSHSEMTTLRFNTADWAKGTYLVRITTGNRMTTKKIVKVD